MALIPGARLGPYEIISPLGAGGMGEVYRATDTVLKRQVALKVLPPEVANDPERVARFAREAEVLAALNHSNIAHLYGVEQSNGTLALVMELVEGDTLADRIARGPIPFDEALPIARQIAEALESAHEQGIIHRDLKPANIKVRQDGTVKVLDFGLAKAIDPVAIASAGGAMTNSPTITSPAVMTGVGVLLGTAAYMEPEQAKGRVADKRADIWAFGVVLFEMVSGRRAYDGETTAEVLAKVLEREPDWNALPKATPIRFTELLRLCLKKDPKARLRDVGDARLQLDELLSGALEGTVVSVRPGAARGWRWSLPIALAAGLAGALIARTATEWSNGALPVTRLQMPVSPADQLAGSVRSVRPSRTVMAISPDGRLVVFSGTRGGVTQLYVRGLEHGEATPVSGTDGAVGPFFSPDGRWIAFWADDKIKKVPTAGGPPATICDVPRLQSGARGLLGASWGEDGTIYFGSGSPTLGGMGISGVSSAGGTVSTVTVPDLSKGERHLMPHALPGGRALLFTSQSAFDWETADIVVQSLDTGERHVLIHGGADARYVATGHLVYLKGGTLMAAPFNLRSQVVTGAPAALLEGVMQAVNGPSGDEETGAGQFTVSASGTLLYLAGGTNSPLERSLVWTTRKGAAQPLAPPRSYMVPRLSPDGQKVAVTISGVTTGVRDVWVCDVAHCVPTRLTTRGRNGSLVWSPDGKRLVYSSNVAGGAVNLYEANADGTGEPKRLTTSNYDQSPSSWSQASPVLAFVETHQSNNQIWILPLEGDQQPWLLLKSSFNLRFPDFSPDGHWLAYVSDESGIDEVYVQPYPGPGQRRRVSENGGQEPIWSSNGQELLYRARNLDHQQFFSAAILSMTPFQADTPRMLFEAKRTEYGSITPIRGWDVSPDGQQFLLTRSVESADEPTTEMNVVLNWQEELKQHVPTR